LQQQAIPTMFIFKVPVFAHLHQVFICFDSMDSGTDPHFKH
jgi:hypothetical protein